MTRLARCLALAVAALGAGCASAPPPDRFVELEHRWVAALQSRDRAALDRLLDDTFFDSTYRGGLRSKADVLNGPPAAGPYRSVRLEQLTVQMYGSRAAVVRGVNVLQGASPEDVVRVRFTDVFVRKGNAWRAVSAQETLQEAGP